MKGSQRVCLLTPEAVERALARMARELVEKNGGPGNLVLMGIHRRGVQLAALLKAEIEKVEGVEVPFGSLDITFYRDDLSTLGPTPQVSSTEMPFDVTGKIIILVDDVLYTGRTVRAALDVIMDWGRPEAIRLAVLVDRGHRELPIRPDFVGKNVPTSQKEIIKVKVKEFDDKAEVVVGEVEAE